MQKKDSHMVHDDIREEYLQSYKKNLPFSKKTYCSSPKRYLLSRLLITFLWLFFFDQYISYSLHSILPVLLFIYSLFSLSRFAELEAEGTLEGHCSGRGKISSVMMIVGCMLFCSSLFFKQCTCYVHECMPVGADLGCYIEFRRFNVTPL